MDLSCPTLIINFFGGPSVGKSTLCAHTFAELKWRGTNCEMALEFAKDKVWENSLDVLENQLYIFGKQHHRLHRLLGKVDIILTDSPLPLSLIYGKQMPQAFRDLVLREFREMNNLNIFLVREKPFNPAGRVQNEEKAKQLDDDIRHMLKENNINAVYALGNREVVKDVVRFIEMSYAGLRKRRDRPFPFPEESLATSDQSGYSFQEVLGGR